MNDRSKHEMAKDKDNAGVSIKMTKKRDTKGTWVYGNEDDGALIRSLYLTKTAVDGEPPAEITVSIAGIKGA
jgi:hypothetical protein